MSSPESFIRRSFDQQLQLFCSQYGLDWQKDVAWPNIGFVPEVEKLFLRPHLMFQAAASASLGPDGFQRYGGIYQISVFEVADSGLGKVEPLIQAVTERFKAGTILDACGHQVRITSAYRETALQEEGRLHIPISVEWSCYAPRSG